MTEIIVGIALLLSLFGNYHQHNKLTETREELTQMQDIANQNRDEWLIAIEVSKNNANVINDLKQALDACEIRYTTVVNDFREASVLKDAALADLRTRLASVDFGVCRVPDWVDFSGAGDRN